MIGSMTFFYLHQTAPERATENRIPYAPFA
jgi:hypothetical protein